MRTDCKDDMSAYENEKKFKLVVSLLVSKRDSNVLNEALDGNTSIVVIAQLTTDSSISRLDLVHFMRICDISVLGLFIVHLVCT